MFTKMRQTITDEVTLPKGVTAQITNGVLTVKGEKGEIQKKLLIKGIDVNIKDSITFEAKNATMLQKKTLFTAAAHTRNMVVGVSEGFTYKLKICSGHFPMSVALKGNKFEVKNFIGEKVPRVIIVKEGADVKIDGEAITVSGINREIVGQVAADIEQLTRRPGFDTRIFQDGIFIVEKAGKRIA